jgi:hypothetical protein
VHVTTPEAAENELELRIILCRDFLDIASASNHQGGVSGGGMSDGDSKQPGETLQKLVDVIESVIDSNSWWDLGGSGQIESLPGGILVISATSQVHTEVEQLLQKLRMAKKPKSGKGTRSRESPLLQDNEVIKIRARGPAPPGVAPAGPNPFGAGAKKPAVNPVAPKDPVINPFTPKGSVANPFK